jgi:hypothetical protein
MAKEQKAGDKPTVPEEKPEAVTYYGKRAGKSYEVWKVLVFADKVKRERVVAHPQRAVAAERLRVLLLGAEVQL